MIANEMDSVLRMYVEVMVKYQHVACQVKLEYTLTSSGP
jgi:hypothetical protein